MDDSDSKVAPSLSPVLPAESGSTRENSTKRLTDKFLVQAKNYVETGSERKALEGTLSFLKLKSLRHNDARKALHAAGLIESLQSLLVSGRAAGEEGDGVKALAWSILANLCAIDKRTQEKVINIALAEICRTLSSSSRPPILNPTCRTLANVMPHVSFPGWDHAFMSSIVQSLSKIISTITESSCLQSALRTLRKVLVHVNNSNEHFLIHRTLFGVLQCLKTQEEDLSSSALSVFETCFTSGVPDLASILWEGEHEGLSTIIGLVRTGSSSREGVGILCHVAKNINGKAVLSRAGGIELLTQRLTEQENKREKEKGQSSLIIDALCHCCRDVHGRQKVRECGALQLLINLLQSEEHSSFHHDILSALICYYFDEQTLQFMIRRLGLIKALLYHLKRGIKGENDGGTREEKDHDEEGEVRKMRKRKKRDEKVGHLVKRLRQKDDSDNFLKHEESFGSVAKSPGSSTKGSEDDINIDEGSGVDIEEDSLDETGDCNKEEHLIAKKSERKKNEAKKKLSNQEKLSNSYSDPPTSAYHKDSEPPSKKLCRTISDEESTSSLYYLSPPYNMEDSGGGRGAFSPSREPDLAYSPLFEKLSPLLNINEDEASTQLQSYAYSVISPPLSKGTFSPSCQAALEANNTLSSPVPTNFIDSLLSPTSCSPVTPSKTIKRSRSHEIGSNHSSSPHSKVLLLLSRVSHLHDCQPILASVDVLSVIMEYYLTTSLKDGHCFKVLSRLFSNPHCFQDCLVTLAPSMLFHHMIMTDNNGGGVASTQCNNDRSATTSNTQATSYQRGMSYPSPPIGDLCNMRLSEKAQDRGSSSNFQTAAPGNQSLLLGDQSPVGVGQSVKDLCVQLLEKLSRVAESPYGQGVIAHMLLRGDERDVMAGSLGLILLEKSHSICHKMLTEYGGLHNLLTLSKGQFLTTQCSCTLNTSTIEDTESKELTPPPSFLPSKASDQETLTQLMAIDTLLYLGSQYHKCPSRRRRHSAVERVSSTTLPLPIKAGPVSPPSLSSPLCLYRDFDHWPFDTCIVLDDGTMFPVHRKVLAESSEVFSVMLSGCYKESTDSSVSLHSVCPSSFRSLVHHVYGCGSHCWGCVSEKETTEHYNDEVIDEIVSSIKEEGQERGRHLLCVLISANQFFIQSLLTAAQESFMLYLSPENVTPLFLFSQLHQCTLLSEAAVQLLVGRGPGVCQSESFLRLVRSAECDEFLSTIARVFHQK